MIATIAPPALREQLEKGADVHLIDVRTPMEFQELHVAGAKNVPLDRLDPADYAGGGARALYVICRSGSRGQTACKMLTGAGVEGVVNVEGGTLACAEAGLSVVRGKQVMSLERQVRVAAGSLVVIGTLLGALVHPYWLGLPGFVGAGLVFAGITDTCGMGMMLARMPWNQCAGSCGTSCKS